MKQHNLQIIKEEFESWRESRPGIKSPTPDYLKSRALSLVGQYKKQDICRALNINHRALKSWEREISKEDNSFVTLPPTESSSVDLSSNASPLSIKIRTPQGFECDLSGTIQPIYLAQLLEALSERGA